MSTFQSIRYQHGRHGKQSKGVQSIHSGILHLVLPRPRCALRKVARMPRLENRRRAWHSADMAPVRVSIVFESGARIGPGKTKLLESIRATGSISAAARLAVDDHRIDHVAATLGDNVAVELHFAGLRINLRRHDVRCRGSRAEIRVVNFGDLQFFPRVPRQAAHFGIDGFRDLLECQGAVRSADKNPSFRSFDVFGERLEEAATNPPRRSHPLGLPLPLSP